MKARIQITVMLVAMIIGTLAANAQSARRGENPTRKATTSKTYNRTPNKSNTTAARKATPERKPQASTQRVQKPQDQRKVTAYMQKTPSTNRSKAVHTQTRTQKPQAKVNKHSSRHVSTTNHHNPKSKYRKPTKTHVGKTHYDPKTNARNTKVYRGHKKLDHNANTAHHKSVTHHRHYYYPVERVKIHVHPMTYRGSYRALYYPAHREIIWTRSTRRYYTGLYPGFARWHYHYGYRIQTMSVFDARYNVGEIARIYGRVYATWFNRETDDLLLFFGGEYPNQVFTVIVPGRVARRYSWRPERWFLGEHIAVTGLITTYDGQAEMVIKKKSQINVY